MSDFKPSVCVDAIFENVSCQDATRQVADAGIGAIEFWGWWDKNLPKLQQCCAEHSLAVAACCTRFISLVDPMVRREYLDGLEQSIATAKQLSCPTLISQVGDFRNGVSRHQQRQSLIDGLKMAVPMLEAADVTLVIEPLNELVDHPGYYLIESREAFEIVAAVGSPQVKVLFDIYHQQISEGHLIHNISSNIEKIGHFHAAGNPGRHELTVGEIDYRKVFEAIQRTDYRGFVGLEYWPLHEAVAGLREVAEWFNS